MKNAVALFESGENVVMFGNIWECMLEFLEISRNPEIFLQSQMESVCRNLLKFKAISRSLEEPLVIS